MRLIVVVRGNSDAGDELDGSSLGIAEERVLARTAPIQQPASIVPIAVRAAEEEAVNLRHLSSVTARTAGYCSLRKGGHARAPAVVRSGHPMRDCTGYSSRRQAEAASCLWPRA